MRAITPVVAIVILLLMTVAAAGMAFLTITTYQSETQIGTQSAIEQIGTRTQTQLRIESVSDGQIYLRNLGQETFSNPSFYVEGRPLNVSGPIDCEAGKLCVFTILENVSCSDGCDLSMGEDMPVGTSLSVEEEELGSEAYCGDATCDVGETCSSCPADCSCTYECCVDTCCSIGTYCSGSSCTSCDNTCDGSCPGPGCTGDDDCTSTPCCGNSVCDGTETCSTCPADCGVCPPQYTLQVEASEAWGGGSDRYGESVKAEIIDGSPKIVGFGAVRVIDDTNASLKIWNYTGGVLSLENFTTWDESGDFTYGHSVDIADVDGDTYNETVTLTEIWSGSAMEGVRILNYSMPVLHLENNTVRSSVWGAVVRVSDVDDDSAKEIVILSHDSDPNSPSKISILNYSNSKTYSEFGPFDLGSLPYMNGANDLFVYDIDQDSDKEILYVTEYFAAMCGEAPCYLVGYLNISTWDGSNFVTENCSDLLGNRARGVHAANIDSDSEIEILTTSSMWDGNVSVGMPGTYDGQLIIWNFDGSNLVVEENYTNSSIDFEKVYAKDVNNDGVVEIIVAGHIKDDWRKGYLSIYTWNTTDLVLNTTYDFGSNYGLFSLDVYDVDGDGTDEILLLGDYLTIMNYTLT